MSGSGGRFPRSLIEFQGRFATESACAEYLFERRWPDGFVCPGCGEGRAWLLKTKAFTYECAACGRQTSVTAGTIMHASKLPLTTWFWAAFLMAPHSNGISALQLQSQLSLGSYRTAGCCAPSCATPWSTPSASRCAALSRRMRRSSPSVPRTTRSSVPRAAVGSARCWSQAPSKSTAASLAACPAEGDRGFWQAGNSCFRARRRSSSDPVGYR
jgi:hypothetical protein